MLYGICYCNQLLLNIEKIINTNFNSPRRDIDAIHNILGSI